MDKKSALLVPIVLCALVLFGQTNKPSANPSEQCADCSLVGEALKAAEELKVGITRGQIEKVFKEDGGMQFPQTAIYTYRKCGYIKIRVDFDPTKVDIEYAKKHFAFSPKDVVVNISRPYVEYPVKD
jgi:hypothetical protein